jgi:hypothetical protein
MEVAQRRGIDVELPLQVGAHLSFRLVAGREFESRAMSRD